MSNLRDLLFGYGEGTELTPAEFVVYNTSTQSQGNGGQCCLWTAPAGSSYAVFEMWSGGGSGAAQDVVVKAAVAAQAAIWSKVAL